METWQDILRTRMQTTAVSQVVFGKNVTEIVKKRDEEKRKRNLERCKKRYYANKEYYRIKGRERYWNHHEEVLKRAHDYYFSSPEVQEKCKERAKKSVAKRMAEDPVGFRAYQADRQRAYRERIKSDPSKYAEYKRHNNELKRKRNAIKREAKKNET